MTGEASDGPVTVPQQLADKAIGRFTHAVEARGGNVEAVVMIAHVSGLGEAGGVFAYQSDDPESNPLEFLLGAVEAIAPALGADVSTIYPDQN